MAYDSIKDMAKGDFWKVADSIALEDIRELDVATQNQLLETRFPFPLKLPSFNTTGIDCAVVVLRRVFRHMPADSHCRAVIFGRKDQTNYGVGKEELDRFRALFRYAWHHLPDLDVNASFDPSKPLLALPLEVMDRQRSLLDILVVDRRMDQSRISFEALMESEVMLSSFWETAQLRSFRDIFGWQEKGEKSWQARERRVPHGPITWKLDLEPNLEDKINKLSGLRAVSGGNTSMLLPEWPTCLRVRMTSGAPKPMGKVQEQRILNLTGFQLLSEAEVDGRYRASETRARYRLDVAVKLRSSDDDNDMVYAFQSDGEPYYPLHYDSFDGKHPSHTGNPLASFREAMATDAMLYYSRFDVETSTGDLDMSDAIEVPQGPRLTNEQTFLERIKALDLGSETGLTPLSTEVEERFPKDIGSGYKTAEEKFFG